MKKGNTLIVRASVLLVVFFSFLNSVFANEVSCRPILFIRPVNISPLKLVKAEYQSPEKSAETKVRRLIEDNGRFPEQMADRLYRLMTPEILDAGIANLRTWVMSYGQSYAKLLRIQLEQKNKLSGQNGKLNDQQQKELSRAIEAKTSQLQREAAEKAKHVARQFISAFARGGSKEDIRDFFDKPISKIALDAVEELKTEWPLSEPDSLIAEDISQNITLVPPVTFDANGDARIELANRGVVAIASKALGTRLIRSRKQSASNKLPFFVTVAHGAGTEQSNAGSFKEVIPALDILFDHGVTIAPDSENAGMGIENWNPDPRFLAANSHVTALEIGKIRDNSIPESLLGQPGLPTAPQIKMGRSLGATTAVIHSFYYPERNPYSVQILGSFSNPLTIGEQIELVRHEVKIGIIKNADEPILDYAKNAVENFLKDLEQASPEKRLTFNLSQLISLYLVGKADEDGGARVIQENQRWARQYTSLAHRWYVRDPIEGTKYADQDKPGYNLWFPYLESKHHLLNQRPNVDADVAKRFFPDLPLELWPKVRNQLISATALTLGMMDFLIKLDEQVLGRIQSQDPQVIAQVQHLRQQADGLKRYRDWIFKDNSKDKPEDERSFLSIVLTRNKISAEDLSNSNWRAHFQTQERIRGEYIAGGQAQTIVPSSTHLSAPEYQRADLLARLAQIKFYFEHSEMNRVERELENLGLLHLQ